jgi:hypothetical protein
MSTAEKLASCAGAAEKQLRLHGRINVYDYGNPLA